MSNLLHCDIGEVVQYLKEQNKVFYAIRLSDCLQHYNESMVKLTIENQKLRVELREILNEIDCRIEHGADSNGHLEAIYNLFKENSNV